MRFSFLPTEVKFFDYFDQASKNLLEGAVILRNLLDDFHDIEEVQAQIIEIEHRGDLK